MDLIPMIAALVAMSIAVGVKLFAAGLINRMKSQIGAVEKEKQQFLNQLKAAQAQKKSRRKTRRPWRRRRPS